MKPKIIIFDLETMPNLKEALKVWPQLSQYPGKTLRASITSIICAGWKYHNEKKTHCINAWDFKNWKTNVNDDMEVCKAIREVLEDADAVVTHNGTRFDWKYLQTRLLINGLKPLPKIPHIDTCTIASRNLYFFNNRLDTLGEFLAGDRKMKHEGWDLWVKAWHKDAQALKKMEKYCKQDVKLLEKCFTAVKPLVSNLPNHNQWKNEAQRLERVEICPTCGSNSLNSNGWRRTKTQIYKRFVCMNCGSWCRGDGHDKNVRAI